MKIPNRCHNWMVAIIGGAIACLIGCYLVFYFGPRPIDEYGSDSGSDSGSGSDSDSDSFPPALKPFPRFDPVPPVLLTPRYITSKGIGEDMFSKDEARHQALESAYTELINKDPDHAVQIRKYARIIQDTVMTTVHGTCQAIIKLQVDETDLRN